MEYPNGYYIIKPNSYDNYLWIDDDWVSEVTRDCKGNSLEIKCNLDTREISIFKNGFNLLSCNDFHIETSIVVDDDGK